MIYVDRSYMELYTNFQCPIINGFCFRRIRTALALNMHDPLELGVPNPRCRSFPDDTYNNYINVSAIHIQFCVIYNQVLKIHFYEAL